MCRGAQSGYAHLMPDLVLLRHGQSTWNAENLFTGWHDVDLTAGGEAEATEAGRLLGAEADLDLRVLHTSVLTRAIRTANLTLDAAQRSWLPVRRHWRLNERHYGDLQGKNKMDTAELYGKEQLNAWRRGYATPPPPVTLGDERHPAGDPRYRDVPVDALPATECLADVVARVVPYWEDAIVPDLCAEGPRGGAVLVGAHGRGGCGAPPSRLIREGGGAARLVPTTVPIGSADPRSSNVRPAIGGTRWSIVRPSR